MTMVRPGQTYRARSRNGAGRDEIEIDSISDGRATVVYETGWIGRVRLDHIRDYWILQEVK